MAFWGKSFVFDECPCEDFDLMIYDIDGVTQSTTGFASAVTIVEENLPARWKPYFYGAKYEDKLNFTLVFGVNQRRLDEDDFLDRYELDVISTWLIGHKQYKWLMIEQDDMTFVRYKCIISGLETVEYGNVPWALKAEVTCDSPFAYMSPQEYSYTINTSGSILFFNRSSLNDYYRPKIIIEPASAGDFTIVNQTDGNRMFKLTGISTAPQVITIDNDKCVITSSVDENIYEKFNYNFFRLVRGYNQLQVSGNGVLKIECEFPINVGG